MNWFVTWHSSVNIEKCKHMTIDNSLNRQYSLSTDVDISIIQQCTEESDLGVTLTFDNRSKIFLSYQMQFVKHLKWLELFNVHFMHSLHTLYICRTHLS